MMSYWAEFAATGRLGTGGDGRLPNWSAWTLEAPRFMVLDTAEGGGLRITEGRDSVDAIVATILADSSYETLRRRCGAFASIYNWAPSVFSINDYEAVGDGLCSEFEIRDMVAPL